MTLRIKSGDVTETLVAATERAGEIAASDALVVLLADDGRSLTYVCSDQLSIETINWMTDKLKHLLLCECGE